MSSAVAMDEGLDCTELVIGLRLRSGGLQDAYAHACCHLYDVAGELLDTVHPGRTRNANGSVVHTGNPLALSGKWDHERIFVFLDALPSTVERISLVVAPGHGLAVPASCHISDRNTEHVLLYRELGPVQEEVLVATLRRRALGWKIALREPAVFAPVAEVGALLRDAVQDGRLAASG